MLLRSPVGHMHSSVKFFEYFAVNLIGRTLSSGAFPMLCVCLFPLSSKGRRASSSSANFAVCITPGRFPPLSFSLTLWTRVLYVSWLPLDPNIYRSSSAQTRSHGGYSNETCSPAKALYFPVLYSCGVPLSCGFPRRSSVVRSGVIQMFIQPCYPNVYLTLTLFIQIQLESCEDRA